MCDPSRVARYVARASAVAGALSGSNPWLMTLKLLAEATGLVADLQGPDVEARVEHLRAETSAVRRSETAVARRGLAILDRVVAEMHGLRLVEDERLEPFAGEVAAEILGLDPEGLAGMIEADLEQGRCTDPGQLEGMIATWIKARLQASLGADDAERLGARLAESLMTALWQEESFRALVKRKASQSTAAFQSRMDRSQRRVRQRLGWVATVAEATREEIAGLRALLDGLAAQLGRPTEDELDALCAACRSSTRERVAESLRLSLCSPLDNQEIREALKAEGLEVEDGPRWPVPSLFSYLPHRLASQPVNHPDRSDDPGDWPALDLADLCTGLGGDGPGHRVLVIGAAGFGKTTFLLHLARAVAPVPRVAMFTTLNPECAQSLRSSHERTGATARRPLVSRAFISAAPERNRNEKTPPDGPGAWRNASRKNVDYGVVWWTLL